MTGLAPIAQLALGGEAVTGGVAGFLAGFSARKIWNVVKLIAATFAGLQVLILGYLEHIGVITVNWEALGSGINNFGSSGLAQGFADFAMGILNFVATIIPAAAGGAVGVYAGWRIGK